MADRKRTRRSPPGEPRGVLARPLDSLFFLLPLIVFYEVTSVCVESFGSGPAQDRVVAFHLLELFFELFGQTGVLLPCLVVVVILLATHLASGEPWRLRGRVVLLMYVESIAWALPLLGMSRFVHLAARGGPTERWFSDLAIGVGAGIYEELVFRLILITVLVIIGADLLRFSHSGTLFWATLISAVLFALHHHPPLGIEPFVLHRFLFRTMAGAYLGAIFVYRGYGPAAGTHIAYNLLVIAVSSW